MNQSESIAKLAEALAKAQGIMEGAAKSGDNPFFKSKYSTLASVWDACRKPLSENGLSVVQATDDATPEMITVETILVHSSGEWIMGKLSMKPVKTDPQSIGSCITYARRYSLAAMVGIAPEDDDGNAASGKDQEKKKESKTKTQAPSEPPCEYPEFDKTEMTTKEQVQKIQILMREKGISDREVILTTLSAFVNRVLASSKELTKAEASKWIEANEPKGE